MKKFAEKFPSISTTDVLSPEAMNELEGGCGQSCKVSCSPGCQATAINGKEKDPPIIP